MAAEVEERQWKALGGEGVGSGEAVERNVREFRLLLYVLFGEKQNSIYRAANKKRGKGRRKDEALASLALVRLSLGLA